VSQDQLRAFARVVDTPELPDSLALTLRLMALGPHLDGVWVAENTQGVVVSFNSDSLVGDEIVNEAEDYE
jgi:hypothetical protein